MVSKLTSVIKQKRHSKLIVLSPVLPQMLSTESLTRNLDVRILYTLDKPNEDFATDSQIIEAMFPKRNLITYVGNISINLAIHS